MPFDTFTLESAVFLCLVQVLTSLPTDPYFHPWREEPAYYRIPDYTQNRPPTEGQWFPSWKQRNATRRAEGPLGYQFGYQSGGDPPYSPRELPSDQLGFGNAGLQSRSLEGLTPDGFLNGADYVNAYPGPQNLGNLYSSHVNCGRGSSGSKERTQNTQKNVRRNYEIIFESESTSREEEAISFEETSRSMRSGSFAKDGNTGNPRIVTPKGGRRPPSGSSKKENKPLNTISTTEKILGNHTTKTSKRPRPSPTKTSGGDIIFPDVYQKKFLPNVAKCAKKSTFCEHLGEEYPSDYIDQVLTREGAMFREFFGQDMLSDANIAERINAPEENSLCPHRQKLIFPQAAPNKEDKWLYIVNNDKYVQGVLVEMCLNPESRCTFTESFPLGYTPYCKQKYIARKLVAIGEDGKPHPDDFLLPACCSCVVKHEASARMSRAVAPPPSQS